MFILIDKPKGITSHDVIDRLRRITGERRIGHGGTLDPAATGLLVVGIGRESTKQLGEITKNTTKTYDAEIILGATSTTQDSEGEITQNKDIKILEINDIENILKSFEGEQEQMPPAYSAIKIKGKKAYDLARSGREVKLEPRKVTIHSIKLLDYSYPILKISCEVSAGTYIRALARDIGQVLLTGAYLGNLRRTQVGKYHIDKAVALEVLTSDNWREHCL